MSRVCELPQAQCIMELKSLPAPHRSMPDWDWVIETYSTCVHDLSSGPRPSPLTRVRER